MKRKRGGIFRYMVPSINGQFCGSARGGQVSVWHEKLNPRNSNPMPVVKFFARLDFNPISLFLDGLWRAGV